MNERIQVKHVHLVGAGGVGVSSLAQYYLAHGTQVSGSDLQASKQTALLIDKGALVYIGSNPSLISKDIDLLIYSPAVSENDPERLKARSLDIKELSYPEALGMVSKSVPFSIAVSGTNGKTTTTTMISELLEHHDLHPTAIIGEVSQKFSSNFLQGNDTILVTEACEYKDSFLNIHHNILVVTNITEDHLDYFSDLADIQDSFISFVRNTKGNGILVCNVNDPNLSSVIQEAKSLGMKIIDYTKYLDGITVSVPGEHNKYNACAALSIMEALSLDIEESKRYLSHSFKGAFRRFQYLWVTKNGAVVYDDYAHNPEGLHLLCDALREMFPEKHIVMLFEPHLYSRTRDLKEGFVSALSQVNHLYLLETYRAREEYLKDEAFLLFDDLLKAGISVEQVTQPEHLVSKIIKKYNEHYVIVSAGAGDVYQYTHQLIEV